MVFLWRTRPPCGAHHFPNPFPNAKLSVQADIPQPGEGFFFCLQHRAFAHLEGKRKLFRQLFLVTEHAIKPAEDFFVLKGTLLKLTSEKLQIDFSENGVFHIDCGSRIERPLVAVLILKGFVQRSKREAPLLNLFFETPF